MEADPSNATKLNIIEEFQIEVWVRSIVFSLFTASVFNCIDSRLNNTVSWYLKFLFICVLWTSHSFINLSRYSHLNQMRSQDRILIKYKEDLVYRCILHLKIYYGRWSLYYILAKVDASLLFRQNVRILQYIKNDKWSNYKINNFCNYLLKILPRFAYSSILRLALNVSASS